MCAVVLEFGVWGLSEGVKEPLNGGDRLANCHTRVMVRTRGAEGGYGMTCWRDLGRRLLQEMPAVVDGFLGS